MNELKYHPKLTHLEYIDNLVLAVRKITLNPQLVMMIDKILCITEKEQLIPYGENYEYLSIWYLNHTITYSRVLRPPFDVVCSFISKLFSATNFDLLKNEIKDLDVCTVLSDKTTELLKECRFPPDMRSYVLPLTVTIYMCKTYTGTNLTTKLHNTMGQIEDILMSRDLDAIYGYSKEIENRQLFIPNLERQRAVKGKIVSSSADNLVVICWIRYFAKRFSGDTKFKFLHYAIKELNRAAAENDRFNSDVMNEFLDQAEMGKNMRLIPFPKEVKMTDMGKDENQKPRSEPIVEKKKRSFETMSKGLPDKRRENYHKHDHPYVFLKRGPGIKFAKPPKAHVLPYTKFCEDCGVFEKHNNKIGKFLHSFVDGQYVGKYKQHAISLDKLMRKTGAKDKS